MNPLGWVIGLGLIALLAIFGPLVLSSVVQRFVPHGLRTYVLILAVAYGAASVVEVLLESPDRPAGALVLLVVFVMNFGIAALLAGSLVWLATFLKRRYGRSNK